MPSPLSALQVMRNIGLSFIKMGQYQDALQCLGSCMDTAPDTQVRCYYISQTTNEYANYGVQSMFSNVARTHCSAWGRARTRHSARHAGALSPVLLRCLLRRTCYYVLASCKLLQ